MGPRLYEWAKSGASFALRRFAELGQRRPIFTGQALRELGEQAGITLDFLVLLGKDDARDLKRNLR